MVVYSVTCSKCYVQVGIFVYEWTVICKSDPFLSLCVSVISVFCVLSINLFF